MLVLDSNHFDAFPRTVAQLTALEVLQLSRNKVASMHEDIGTLVSLQVRTR